mmetsp:Transcript_6299/g.12550  ORF Transcript_6299/g.12550 Transcript_6299/m.12550 type:complete len:115 (+) Transcript_6299:652-996(+)
MSSAPSSFPSSKTSPSGNNDVVLFSIDFFNHASDTDEPITTIENLGIACLASPQPWFRISDGICLGQWTPLVGTDLFFSLESSDRPTSVEYLGSAKSSIRAGRVATSSSRPETT